MDDGDHEVQDIQLSIQCCISILFSPAYVNQ